MEKCTAHITDCDMKDDDSSSCHVRARGDEAQAPLLLNPFNFILYSSFGLSRRARPLVKTLFKRIAPFLDKASD